METEAKRKFGSGCGGRRFRTAGAVAALLVLPVVFGAGCGDKADEKFRDAAFDSVESGIKSILDGIISGVFAINDDLGSASSTSSPESPEG